MIKIQLIFAIRWHAIQTIVLNSHAEKYCGRLCLHPNCLIDTVGCFSWGIDLYINVSGEFAKGLVVSGAAACITLF